MSGANGNGDKPNRSKTPIRVVHEHSKRSKHRNGHPRQSPLSQSHGGSSVGSTRDDQWSDFASDTEYSSMTSVSGSPRITKAAHVKYPHGGSHNKPRVPRYVEEPANFGVEPARRPNRQHRVNERPDPLYFMRDSDRRVKGPSAAPRATRMADSIPVDNLAQIRDAYHAGREDEKHAAEAEDPYSKATRYRPASPRFETRPRTEIHQDYEHDTYGLPGIRLVTTSEIGRQINLEDRARMRSSRDIRPRQVDERDARYRYDQMRRTAAALDEHEEIMREIAEADRLRSEELRNHLSRPYHGRSGGQFGVDLGRDTSYGY